MTPVLTTLNEEEDRQVRSIRRCIDINEQTVFRVGGGVGIAWCCEADGSML